MTSAKIRLHFNLVPRVLSLKEEEKGLGTRLLPPDSRSDCKRKDAVSGAGISFPLSAVFS